MTREQVIEVFRRWLDAARIGDAPTTITDPEQAADLFMSLAAEIAEED